jgi:hypothetical protein
LVLMKWQWTKLLHLYLQLSYPWSASSSFGAFFCSLILLLEVSYTFSISTSTVVVPWISDNGLLFITVIFDNNLFLPCYTYLHIRCLIHCLNHFFFGFSFQEVAHLTYEHASLISVSDYASWIL